MLTEKALERAIKTEREIWDRWLAEVQRLGPGHHEPIGSLLASSGRYSQLVTLQRTYFPDSFYKRELSE